MATTTKKTTKKPVAATKSPRSGDRPAPQASRKKAEEGVVKEFTVFSADGKAAGSVKLPEVIAETRWNPRLVHQVVVGEMANRRMETAHTKDRGEVRGGGRKPWQQKGTGRARHGSIRSPLWRGGGTAHGPRAERRFDVKINKAMRRAALRMVLARKIRDNEVVFVDALNFTEPKTSRAKVVLAQLAKGAKLPDLATRRRNAALVALAANDRNTKRSFRNMGNIEVEEARNLTASRLLGKRFLIIENPDATLKGWSN